MKNAFPAIISWLLVLVVSCADADAAATKNSGEPNFERALTPDTSIPIPPIKSDNSGVLLVRASPTSSKHDFDFLVGNWKLKNRKLSSRLTDSKDWVAYESRVEMHQILDGMGNIDKYTELVPGKTYEGVALRLFNPSTKLWSIYWADGNSGALDPPVVGSFTDGIGHFFGRDKYKGRPIIVVFRWDARNVEFPIWSQAFSVDEGKTWEWNSINVSERSRDID